MLLFATVLDINEKLTHERFFELIIEWNDKQYYEENRIPDLKWTGEYGVRLGSDKLWLSFEEYESSIAVRFEKRNPDGAVWDTDYVMNFRNMKMAIRLERSYTEEALKVNGQFSAPYFITLLIDKGYLKKDKGLPIQRGATVISENNLSLLADLIAGKTQYKLPVVYVSKTFNNEDPVDVEAMAKKLRGMAHVMVQEDLSLNKQIQMACAGKNEYRGEIGIYLQKSSSGHKKLKYRREVGQDPMLMEKVIGEVLLYGNSQMIDPLFTWQGIRNALLLKSLDSQKEARSRYEQSFMEAQANLTELEKGLDEKSRLLAEEAREKAISEANELLESYDEEERKLNEKIEDLTKANEALMIENSGLRQRLQNANKTPLLTRGEEEDLYAGEVKDLILFALSEALKSFPEGSRRHDAVSDIIEHNDYQHLTEKNAEEIKNLLRSFSGVPAKLKQELERMGFEISGDGKHYKLCFKGDPRYTTTMAKTPSDKRAGMNVYGEINRNLFC